MAGRHREHRSGKPKQPGSAFVPPAGAKKPRTPEYDGDDVLKRRPVWRFELFDHDGPWSFAAGLTPDVLVDLLRKLANFERMTIGELFHTGEEPGKHYDVDDMPTHVKNRLTDIERDDETRLSRLRLDGTCRLYGVLREHIFHVLWWDPEHEVYPSPKRHT